MTTPNTQPGTLYRAPMKFESSFTQLPNVWLRDERLSRGARGLLAELMTHKVGFSLSIMGLAARGSEGKDALRRMVAELEKCGYLKREKQERKGTRFAGTRWTLMDPWEALVTPPPLAGFPTTENPPTGAPLAGFPTTENPPLRTPISKTLINGDFPEQPSVVQQTPVDNSRGECGHPMDMGRCLYACRADFERRTRS